MMCLSSLVTVEFFPAPPYLSRPFREVNSTSLPRSNSMQPTITKRKEDPTENYTMTSSFLDDVLIPLGIDLSADADESRIMFCELYAQDYFPGLPHRFHDK